MRRHLIGCLGGKTFFGEHFFQGLDGHLAFLIQHHEDIHVTLLRDAQLTQQIRHHLAIIDVDAHVARPQIQGAECLSDAGQDPGFGLHGRLADDIEIPLEVLALTAASHALVAEALADGPPFRGKHDLLRARGDHAHQRRRDLGTQRKLPVRFVLEVIDLLRNLFAGLARQQLEGFHDGRLEALESVHGGGIRPGGEDAVAQIQVFGIEVAHAARRFELHKY